MPPQFLETVKRKPFVTITSYLGILCGYYFKYGSKVTSFLICSSCMILCLSLLFLRLWLHYQLYDLIRIMEYTVRCLLMLCGFGRKYMNFLTYLDDFDLLVGFNSTYRHFLCCYICLTLLAIIEITWWLLVPPGLSYLVVLHSCFHNGLIVLNQIYGMIILESFWRRLQFIRIAMQRDVLSNSGSEINHPIIVKHLRFYLQLLNNLESVSLLFSVQVLLSCFETFFHCQRVFPIFFSAPQYMPLALCRLASYYFQVCAPVILIDFGAQEHEKMQLIIVKLLFKSKDVRERVGLMKARRFLKLRGNRRTMLRMLPLDATLPLALVSFCFTYIVAYLQLLKLV